VIYYILVGFQEKAKPFLAVQNRIESESTGNSLAQEKQAGQFCTATNKRQIVEQSFRYNNKSRPAGIHQ